MPWVGVETGIISLHLATIKLMKKSVLFPLLLSLFIVASCNGVKQDQETSPVETAPPPTAAPPAASEVVAQEKLIGKWQRTDGGYVIEIKALSQDGKLDAGYYNPNPINVGRAAWQNDGGRLMVLIELSDVNYPGSTYSLEYQPQGDKLAGNYFQAVEKQTYQVEFSRLK
jgi:uncharacterized protein (DUF2147 family)